MSYDTIMVWIAFSSACISGLSLAVFVITFTIHVLSQSDEGRSRIISLSKKIANWIG